MASGPMYAWPARDVSRVFVASDRSARLRLGVEMSQKDSFAGGFSPLLGHRTVTDASIMTFGGLTGDYAQMHFDLDFGPAAGMGARSRTDCSPRPGRSGRWPSTPPSDSRSVIPSRSSRVTG